jgi:hypothetical protein
MGTGSLHPQHIYVGYVTKMTGAFTHYATDILHKIRGYVFNEADQYQVN